MIVPSDHAKFDDKALAVVGAGVMGIVTALTLQIDGHVTLFDRQPFPPTNTSMMAVGMLAPYSESDILPYGYVRAGLEGIDPSKPFWATGARIAFSDRAAWSSPAQTLIIPWPSRIWAGKSPSQPCPDRIFCGRSRRSASVSKPVSCCPMRLLLPDIAMGHLFERFLSADGALVIGTVDPPLLPGFRHVVDCREYVDGLVPDLAAVQGELIIVAAPKQILRRPIRMLRRDTPYYLVPRLNGHIAIGTTAIRIDGDADDRVRTRSISSLLSFACDAIPELAHSRLVGAYSGVRAAYANLLPRLQSSADGRVIGLNGLYRHGFLLAPMMAQSALHLLRGLSDPNASLFDGMANNPTPELQGED